MKYLSLLFILTVTFFGNCFEKESSEKIPFEKDKVMTLHRYGKRFRDNPNELLWLSKKYNIIIIGGGCVVSESEILEANNEHKTILSKYGDAFWGKVENEVDSIEKNDLFYKKMYVKKLEEFLNNYNCTIKSPADGNIMHPCVNVYFNIDSSGKVLNTQLEIYPYNQTFFGKKVCTELEANLTNILKKMPLLKPSTFLNEPIEDYERIEILCRNWSRKH